MRLDLRDRCVDAVVGSLQRGERLAALFEEEFCLCTGGVVCEELFVRRRPRHHHHPRGQRHVPPSNLAKPKRAAFSSSAPSMSGVTVKLSISS